MRSDDVRWLINEQGCSAEQVARAFRLDPLTVSNWAKNGIKATKLSKEQVAQIVREYLSGASVPTLAAEFKVSQAAICYWLDKIAVRPIKTRQPRQPRQRKARGKLSPEMREAIARGIEDGQTYQTVAARFGVSVGTVQYWYLRRRIS